MEERALPRCLLSKVKSTHRGGLEPRSKQTSGRLEIERARKVTRRSRPRGSRNRKKKKKQKKGKVWGKPKGESPKAEAKSRLFFFSNSSKLESAFSTASLPSVFLPFTLQVRLFASPFFSFVSFSLSVKPHIWTALRGKKRGEKTTPRDAADGQCSLLPLRSLSLRRQQTPPSTLDLPPLSASCTLTSSRSPSLSHFIFLSPQQRHRLSSALLISDRVLRKRERDRGRTRSCSSCSKPGKKKRGRSGQRFNL